MPGEFFFFFQAEDGIRDYKVTGVQTCALPISVSNIQISNILLWQKDQQFRNLEFRHNHVNVITGDAGKGKSSILFIIDYCLLASETKGISKTNIDSKVDWYGIDRKSVV